MAVGSPAALVQVTMAEPRWPGRTEGTWEPPQSPPAGLRVSLMGQNQNHPKLRNLGHSPGLTCQPKSVRHICHKKVQQGKGFFPNFCRSETLNRRGSLERVQPSVFWTQHLNPPRRNVRCRRNVKINRRPAGPCGPTAWASGLGGHVPLVHVEAPGVTWRAWRHPRAPGR